MIRIFNKQLVAVESGSVYVADIYCDSSDTKPTTELANGSTLTEVDTGKKYLFNEATTSWVEVSGGGGGGSANTKEVYTGMLDGLGTKLTEIAVANGGVDTFTNNISNANISASLALDLFGDGDETVMAFTIPTYSILVANVASFGSGAVQAALSISTTININVDGTKSIILQKADAEFAGSYVDLKQNASNIPYTLTLYFHEMPQA